MHGGSLLRYEEPQSCVGMRSGIQYQTSSSRSVIGWSALLVVNTFAMYVWAPEHMAAASVSRVVVTLQVAP